MNSNGGELRMHITPYPEVAAHKQQTTPSQHATRSTEPISFANATLADIQFPTFSAGPLGPDADWKANDAGFGSPSRNAAGDSAIFRSTDGPTPLHAMQLHDLQSAVRRKDELLEQFQEQIADMTRTLNAQAIARHNWEEHEAEREGALADAQAEASRLAAALEGKQSELIHAKQLLKASAERTEANMRSAQLEFEESAALLSSVQQDLAAAQSDLAAQKSATSRANTRAQEAEAQLALLEQHNAELAAQLKTNADDTAYINKELQGAQAQCQLKEQERQQAVAAGEAQRKTVTQLTAELDAQREDMASLPALRQDSAALATLRADHSMLRDAHSALEAELAMHKNLLAMRDEECAKMQARLTAQEEAIRKLTATNTELADERVDVSALRTQVAQTQQELDSAKATNKSLSTTNQHLRHSLDDLESRQIPQLKQRIMELEGIETRLKLDLDQRGRHLKQHTEQMRTISAKNPFNSRIDAAPKSNATGNAPGVAIGIKESEASGSSTPATGSAAATADADSFSQLRDQLTAQLLDLNARTRLAYGLLLDSERALKHCQDELLDSKKQNILLQREAAGNAAETSERMQVLEQQLMQSQQELLITRSESQDSLAAASSNQAQMSMLWQSCQLLHRSYRPLLARFRDVCAQKAYLAGQVHYFQCGTARDVFELRKAMTSFENKQAATAVSTTTAASNPALDSLAPSRPHPYRLHSGRLSFRVAVIAILAARRIWTPHGSEYGSMISMGEQSLPVLQSNAFVLSAASSESKDHDGLESQNPRAQARRDREMLVPSVDGSTANKAVASLMRLLEHFDSSSAYSAYSAAYPLLKRPNLSSRQSLLELLSNGQGFFQATRARNSAGRAPFATSSSLVVPVPAASTRDDLARIRGVAWFLASSNKKLEQQLLALQAEYVLVIEQSGRTEEKLAQEQARAHEIMRDCVEKAREHENRNNELIAELRSALAAAEADKQRMVSKDEYASLHHTSEMVLVKCRELERENHMLQDLHATLKARSEQDQQELSEREMVMRGLQRTIDQKTAAITSLEKAQRNANDEMQQAWAQLRQAQQALLTSQQELVDARNEIQQLRIAIGDLEHHRDDLSAEVSDLHQELLRVKELIRGVTHAHRMAELQDPVTTAAAAAAAGGGASQALVTRPPPHPLSSSLNRSSAYHLSPLSSSVSFLPGGSDLSGSSGPPIEVRHHPNGNLSVDFGGAVLQHSAGTAADSSAGSAGALSSFAPPYPAVTAPPAAASSSSSSTSHRGLFTPLPSASRSSPRVKFSHDTK